MNIDNLPTWAYDTTIDRAGRLPFEPYVSGAVREDLAQYNPRLATYVVWKRLRPVTRAALLEATRVRSASVNV